EIDLIEQLQTEYIRQCILETSTALSAAFGARSGFVERLAEIGRQAFTRPYARIRPEARELVTNAIDRAFAELPAQIQRLLEEAPVCVPHLKANMRLAKMLGQTNGPLQAAARRGFLLPDDLKWLEEFQRDKWAKNLKKSGACLEIPAFIESVSEFLARVDMAFDSL